MEKETKKKMNLFVDCGGYSGNSVKWWKDNVGGSWNYVSFEPSPKGAKEIWRLFPSVDVIQAAVWNENDKRVLRIGSGDVGESSSLIATKKIRGINKTRNSKIVNTIDFSAWLLKRTEKRIVVKMNIEGAEYTVLPHLIRTGAIRRIEKLYVDWHWKKCKIKELEHKSLIKKIPIPFERWGLHKDGQGNLHRHYG